MKKGCDEKGCDEQMYKSLISFFRYLYRKYVEPKNKGYKYTSHQKMCDCGDITITNEILSDGGGGGGGTITGATNIGNLGIGPFVGINGTLLEFYNIAPSDPAIIVELDIVNGNILIDFDPSPVDINLFADILDVPKGGTGNSSLTAGNFLIGNGVGPVQITKVAPAGVVVGDTDVQTLTNKTMTDPSDNVIARGLWYGSGAANVSTYLSGAPAIGDILVATSTTTATWIPVSDVSDMCDAIVSTGGEPGTYPKLSAAITAGATYICVRAGTYAETTQIVLPAGVIIIGERATNTIITFAGLAVPALTIDGNTGVITSAGLISIPNGSNIVTGSGTTFTSLTPGCLISLSSVFYTIQSITNDTSLTITDIYRGRALVGATFVAYKMATGVQIEGITFANISCTSSGISIIGLQNTALRKCVVAGFPVSNVTLSICNVTVIENVLLRSSSGIGLVMNNVYNSAVNLSGCVNNGSDGIQIGLNSFNIFLTDLVASNNGASGINIQNNASIVNISRCVMESNQSSGCVSNNSTSIINFVECTVVHNNNGINCGGTPCSVAACMVTNNTGDGILASTNGLITCNTCAFNGGNGISMQSNDNNTVSGNTLNNNDGHGITIGGNTMHCTITGNTIYSNGGRGIDISGNSSSDNILNGNVIKNNTQEGIFIKSDNIIITGGRCYGNLVGISIQSTSDSTIISGCNIRVNTTNLINNGTNTLITGSYT